MLCMCVYWLVCFEFGLLLRTVTVLHYLDCIMMMPGVKARAWEADSVVMPVRGNSLLFFITSLFPLLTPSLHHSLPPLSPIFPPITPSFSSLSPSLPSLPLPPSLPPSLPSLPSSLSSHPPSLPPSPLLCSSPCLLLPPPPPPPPPHSLTPLPHSPTLHLTPHNLPSSHWPTHQPTTARRYRRPSQLHTLHIISRLNHRGPLSSRPRGTTGGHSPDTRPFLLPAWAGLVRLACRTSGRPPW